MQLIKPYWPHSHQSSINISTMRVENTLVLNEVDKETVKRFLEFTDSRKYKTIGYNYNKSKNKYPEDPKRF